MRVKKLIELKRIVYDEYTYTFSAIFPSDSKWARFPKKTLKPLVVDSDHVAKGRKMLQWLRDTFEMTEEFYHKDGSLQGYGGEIHMNPEWGVFSNDPFKIDNDR